MDTIQSSTTRVGRFTSSSIAALMSTGKQVEGFGKPAITLIEEKRFERKLGRSLEAEMESRPTTWGSLVEKFVFENMLGTEYELMGDVTIQNPDIEYHAGSPDCKKHGNPLTVVDCKSPKTLKSYCQFYECATIQDVIDNHDSGKDYYYQLISNAILTGAERGELFIFCPYKSQLEAIKTMARHTGEPKYSWIAYADDNALPWLVDGGKRYGPTEAGS